MADEKQTTGQEERVSPEAVGPESPGTAPGDVVVDINTIDELIKKRNAEKREAIEQEEAAGEGKAAEAGAPPTVEKPGEDSREPWEKTSDELAEETKKPRRGRPPKEGAEQTVLDGDKKDKAPKKGRQPKADKAAPEKAAKPVRDKVSQSGKAGKTAPAQEAAPAPVPEQPPEPAVIPRPVEEGQVVYLKLSELHAFHTFRDHPYKVQDDDKMKELVGTIQEHGVMTPATVRPEKEGGGYEIIAGHRRQHGSQLAGLEEMPCIVRNMTDLEAVREMKISNKQRGDPLPSELARLFDLEVEAIKHQGGALDGVAAGDVGKRSTEIVGENNGMNYKKVMRYIRLNSLVPDLLNMVDEKKMGFMPAVELSYIKPKNQRLIAVSIEGEQSSPSLSQAQKLRELDKEGKLSGDVIDGILGETKKEVDKVIISTAELGEFFDKTATPREMKDQILALLGEWKDKQPPELGKPEKKVDMEK